MGVPHQLDALARDSNPSRVQRTITPAGTTGGTISIPVPGGVLWRVISARMLLTCTAVVANRRPIWTVTDGVATVAECINGVAITASNVPSLCYAPNLGSAQSAAGLPGNYQGIPDIWMLAGYTFGVVVNAADVGDTLTQVAVLVDEILDQPFDYAAQREAGYIGSALAPDGETGFGT